MTLTAPRPTVVTTRPGRLARLKLSEPVRLYAYGILSAVVVALVLVGTITGEWGDALLGIVAAVLGVVPGAEAARASVYSPRTHMQDLLQLREATVAAARVERAAGL